MSSSMFSASSSKPASKPASVPATTGMSAAGGAAMACGLKSVRRGAQLGKELCVGFAEIDRCDGVDINHRHRRCRCIGAGVSTSAIGAAACAHPPQRRRLRHPRGFRPTAGAWRHRRSPATDAVRRRRPATASPWRAATARRRRYPAHRRRNGTPRRHGQQPHRARQPPGRTPALQSQWCQGYRRVDVVLDIRHCHISRYRWCRLRQRPLRHRFHSGFGAFEADRIETGEGRAAFVFGTRGRIGVRMERREIPLRHLGRRRAGGGEDQRRLAVVMQRQRCGCVPSAPNIRRLSSTSGAGVAGGGSR